MELAKEKSVLLDDSETRIEQAVAAKDKEITTLSDSVKQLQMEMSEVERPFHLHCQISILATISLFGTSFCISFCIFITYTDFFAHFSCCREEIVLKSSESRPRKRCNLSSLLSTKQPTRIAARKPNYLYVYSIQC